MALQTITSQVFCGRLKLFMKTFFELNATGLNKIKTNFVNKTRFLVS